MKIIIDKPAKVEYHITMFAKDSGNVVSIFGSVVNKLLPSQASTECLLEPLTVKWLLGVFYFGGVKLCLIHREHEPAIENKSHEKPLFKAQTFHGYPLTKTLRQKQWGVGKIEKRELGEAEIDPDTRLTTIANLGLIVNNADLNQENSRYEALFYPGDALSICQTDSCK